MVAGRGTRVPHCITTRERGILEADGVIADSKWRMRGYVRRVYVSGTIELLYVGVESNLGTRTTNFGRVC